MISSLALFEDFFTDSGIWIINHSYQSYQVLSAIGCFLNFNFFTLFYINRGGLDIEMGEGFLDLVVGTGFVGSAIRAGASGVVKRYF